MATYAQELFQQFRAPSPGTSDTSLQFFSEYLRPGAADSDVGWHGCSAHANGESSSSQLAGHGFATAAGAVMPFAFQPRLVVQQPATVPPLTGHYQAQPDFPIVLGADAVQHSSQAPAFSLGPGFATSPTSLEDRPPSPAALRRRGRRPKPRLPDLQQKLEALTEQFNQLSHENVFMRSKLKILERMVPLWDQRAGLLRKLLSSAQEQAPQAEAAAPAAPAAAAAGYGATSHPVLQSWDQTSVRDQLAGSEVCPSTAVARSVLHPQRAGIRVGTGIKLHRAYTTAAKTFLDPNPHKGARKGAAGLPPLVAMFPGPDDELPPMSPEVIRHLSNVTKEDFCMLWRQICTQFGVLLVGAEMHGVGSPPYQRFERYYQNMLTYMDKIMLLTPTCFLSCMYMNVETGLHERPNDQFWVSCARALQLNPQQLRDVASLATMYERNMAPMVQQRQQLAAQLSTGLAEAASVSACRRGLESRIEVDELARQLERNTLKEKLKHQNVSDFLCSSLLTPLQLAKLIVGAYPYILDPIALLHAFITLGGSGANQQLQQAQ
ncbi:hypothetical protein Agub_g10107 [Astrephomene gubernaculifera]|uniref:Uncharacterized protein n=1 Tax=Astrephomene gubernaculifera TaxID=47775 RepID=A0AAD3HNS8_9CHLO|nr:hypothetical protein Agub_g10107 [Astrephomene gubernaculifera]